MTAAIATWSSNTSKGEQFIYNKNYNRPTESEELMKEGS